MQKDCLDLYALRYFGINFTGGNQPGDSVANIFWWPACLLIQNSNSHAIKPHGLWNSGCVWQTLLRELSNNNLMWI